MGSSKRVVPYFQILPPPFQRIKICLRPSGGQPGRNSCSAELARVLAPGPLGTVSDALRHTIPWRRSNEPEPSRAGLRLRIH